MTTLNNPQFQTYLKSISDKYKHWRKLYTFTDAEGNERENEQPGHFDFGLVVETLQPKPEQQRREQEKTERLPVLKGIRKYASNHVLLIGKPGSGKSTALARLLLEESQNGVNNATIPILVELRYWQESVFERIQAFLKQQDANLNINTATLDSLLTQGKFLLLIDGVNELPSEDARQKVLDFRKQYHQTPMIFTTRDLGVGGDLGIEKKLEMQPLSEMQMREFVMAYLPQQGEKMLRRLGERLQEFGKTPLLLLMLCDLFRQTGKIPPNLGMVFRSFTRNYENLDNWKRSVPVTAESRRSWQDLLEYLAFKMMQGEPVTEFRVAIPKREVEDIFTEYLTEEKFDKPREKAKCWLEDLLNHHLIQVGSGDNIEFRHQLLQEYYAAEYVLRQLPSISKDILKRDYLNLLKWTEPLALMLALVEYKNQAMLVVQLALDVDLMLGARLAGEVKPDFQEATVKLILNKKLSKSLEVTLLDITRSNWAVAALIDALKDEDSDVRWSAASALGEIGSEKAVTALIDALKDKNSSVRRSAAFALEEIGSEKAVTALIDALKDEDSDVRWSAASALGEIGSEKTVTALIDALKDENLSVRWGAVLALRQIGSEKAVTALIDALNGENSDVRKNAAEALGEIGSEKAVTALIDALNYGDSDVCRSAVLALRQIGSEKAVTALIDALNGENSDVRRSAASALGEIGSEKAVTALIDALNYGDSDVRRSAAEALGKIGSEKAEAALIDALNDGDLDIGWSAVLALGKIGNQRAEAALIDALNYGDSFVRWSAVEALGEIGSEKAVAALIDALNDEDSDVCWSAAEALGEIGSEKAVAALIDALNGENSDVCWSAAEALGKIGSEKAVAALIDALNYEDLFVVWSAAEALGEIGSEKAVAALIDALNHEDSSVGRIAALALGKIGDERAVAALIDALNYEDLFVRRRAAEALGRIAGADQINKMWNLLLDGTYQTEDIILKIQQRCKFYNYDIFHSPQREEQKENDVDSKYHIKAEVVQIIEKNDGKIYGK
ncbi:HEAT repeat domain-containing protein [Anabaena azotica]|uniref:HEAT repeat domain-containing protein n=1 Tax=Anabaena azotica FACHB-119 TaxID=947527 RepID=A0ABR8D494_9NOST|nr:HEAT repeat domain-containing protein [Anabaena azotica]MBD2501766.1 HEAT repeat domain-containing protein [Anabaena azotica FACHB-119]